MVQPGRLGLRRIATGAYYPMTCTNPSSIRDPDWVNNAHHGPYFPPRSHTGVGPFSGGICTRHTVASTFRPPPALSPLARVAYLAEPPPSSSHLLHPCRRYAYPVWMFHWSPGEIHVCVIDGNVETWGVFASSCRLLPRCLSERCDNPAETSPRSPALSFKGWTPSLRLPR